MDLFTYVVSFSGGTVTGSVQVLVVSGDLPSENTVSLTVQPTGIRLRFAGVPGHAYDIQRATMLVPANWTTLATITAPLHGIIEYEDADPLMPTVFYRTAAP